MTAALDVHLLCCRSVRTRALALAVLGINCTQLVRPRDASPIRSPQNIHSWLSERFTGLDIVEIGTRDGDGMACFAQTARAAVAVEAAHERADGVGAPSERRRGRGQHPGCSASPDAEPAQESAAQKEGPLGRGPRES